MNTPTLNAAHQLVVIMRLAEFCRWDHRLARHFAEPWEYMRDKLLQTEPALESLKTELLAVTRAALLKELSAGPLREDRFSDYKGLLEKLLRPGDFADVAFHLTEAGGGPKPDLLRDAMSHLRPSSLFIEEARPLEARSRAWEKLVTELYERLGLKLLGRVLENGPKSERRRALVLRRVRHNTREYCSVVHIPTDPNETFTPFMLPRVEAVIAANLRFLNTYR